MSNLLLIDKTRFFLDGRPCITARNAETAVKMLTLHEKTLTTIWYDHDVRDPEFTQKIIHFFKLRHKLGLPYSVATIHVHTPSEGAWQQAEAALRRVGITARRATIQNNLG